jgi:hypothetical protein
MLSLPAHNLLPSPKSYEEGFVPPLFLKTNPLHKAAGNGFNSCLMLRDYGIFFIFLTYMNRLRLIQSILIFPIPIISGFEPQVRIACLHS